MAPEAVDEVFEELTRIRGTWGTLFSGLGQRLDDTSLTKFNDVMKDKWKDYLGANYRLFQNDSMIPALTYKPSKEAV